MHHAERRPYACPSIIPDARYAPYIITVVSDQEPYQTRPTHVRFAPFFLPYQQ